MYEVKVSLKWLFFEATLHQTYTLGFRIKKSYLRGING